MPSSLSRAMQATPVTIVLIAINLVVFVLGTFLVGQPAYIYSMQGLSVLGILYGRWWTLLTSMFMHGGLTHLLCNMVSLYYLGSIMERLYGSRRFLGLYLVAGVVGGLVFVAYNYALGVNGRCIGASGAIFGLFGAYGILLFLESRKPAILPQEAARQSLQSFLGLLAVNVLIGFTPGIAWEAHFGGLVSGALIGWFLYRGKLRERAQRV